MRTSTGFLYYKSGNWGVGGMVRLRGLGAIFRVFFCGGVLRFVEVEYALRFFIFGEVLFLVSFGYV